MATQLNKGYGAQIAKDLNKLSARLRRLERVLMSAAGAIIILLATLVWINITQVG